MRVLGIPEANEEFPDRFALVMTSEEAAILQECVNVTRPHAHPDQRSRLDAIHRTLSEFYKEAFVAEDWLRRREILKQRLLK
jgi:hypothetical protein